MGVTILITIFGGMIFVATLLALHAGLSLSNKDSRFLLLLIFLLTEDPFEAFFDAEKFLGTALALAKLIFNNIILMLRIVWRVVSWETMCKVNMGSKLTACNTAF